MRRLLPIALTTLLCSAAMPSVHAWGFTGHKLIMDRTIALLPAEIRPFFEKYRTTVVEHSIDPDTYRTMGFADEPPRHFLDMDAYGAFPFTDLPHDYNAAVAKYGRDFVVKNGVLPWRTGEIHDRLREAFRQTGPFSREDIKLFSAVVGHYLADAFQPFHATRNYDGQATGQQGIHARFETELVERYGDKLHLTPGPLVPVPNAREFTFATLTDSFQLVEPILAADKAAVSGRDEYDDAYFAQFFSKTQPILEQRLSQAITGVASAITAAWIDAGRPPLPADAPRTVRKVRRGGQ